ncbi:HigA family addiction module antitoxin [Magnetococcales bacterium HHB-1]
MSPFTSFYHPHKLIQHQILAPPRRINEIVLEKRSVSADTDLRLARYFGVSEGYWLGLQMEFDLEKARRTIDEQLLQEIIPIKTV